MTDSEIIALFAPQYADFHNLALYEKRPLLAHYTSLDVLEKIMKSGEVWFSNPLFMNDLQEMGFGMLEGFNRFKDYSHNISFGFACGTPQRADILRSAFESYFNDFDRNHALDVYVFCLSEHKPEHGDGLLSMWRGYGGNGNGATLVFSTDFLTLNTVSPLLFVKVKYGSERDRISWIEAALQKCMTTLATNRIPDDKLYLVAHQMFELMKLYSLTSKHPGFLEEEEWRIIYLPDRDTNKF
jgi:hypothetical protein